MAIKTKRKYTPTCVGKSNHGDLHKAEARNTPTFVEKTHMKEKN